MKGIALGACEALPPGPLQVSFPCTLPPTAAKHPTVLPPVSAHAVDSRLGALTRHIPVTTAAATTRRPPHSGRWHRPLGATVASDRWERPRLARPAGGARLRAARPRPRHPCGGRPAPALGAGGAGPGFGGGCAALRGPRPRPGDSAGSGAAAAGSWQHAG